MKKAFKMALLIISIVIAGGAVYAIAFLNLSPQFGGDHSSNDRERYSESGHYKDGKFINLVPTSMDMGMKDGFGVFMEYLKGGGNRVPEKTPPALTCDPSLLAAPDDSARLLWFGHSAFLLQMEGKNIFVDPMLGDRPSPHPFFGKERFNPKLPIEIKDLPQIDIVLISHDHYDHLDYGSVRQLADKTDMFLAPLGVGAHLREWGVPEEKIKEFNWWEENERHGLRIAFTPARHFSGRGMSDRNSTLWGSWVVQGATKKIFFSGDSGYGPHFREIGEKYGPFDFALLECGQYNELWSQIHMMPEETAQAAIDVQTKVMMPVHWGAFTLALHSWTDPVERVTLAARKLDKALIVPQIGELVDLNNPVKERIPWWEDN